MGGIFRVGWKGAISIGMESDSGLGMMSGERVGALGRCNISR